MFGEVFGGWELWEGFLFLLFLVLLDVGKIGVLFFLGLVGFGVVFKGVYIKILVNHGK